MAISNKLELSPVNCNGMCPACALFGKVLTTYAYGRIPLDLSCSGVSPETGKAVLTVNGAVPNRDIPLQTPCRENVIVPGTQLEV